MIKKKALGLGAGVVLGLVGGKVLNSKFVKKAAVATVKEGLKIKDSLDKTVENIKVSTEDIIAEAKVVKEAEEREEAERKANLDIEKVACECGCEKESEEEENKEN